MTLRRLSALTSSALSKSAQRLFGSTKAKERRRQQARRRFVEQLESRQLMALNILSVSPVDGATDVARDTDLQITFNENVLKGQGNIHVVNSATGKLGVAVDVTSSSVTVSGSVVMVDLPQDLNYGTQYTVFIDAGTFIDTSSTPTADAPLLIEGFDFLPLLPAVFETVGDGTDVTHTPPINWSVDNSAMPTTATYGVPDWDGWTFADKGFWIASDNQNRDAFVLGQGTVAVADSDEYDDRGARPGPFDSSLISKPIFLNGVASNSVNIQFDSSFRPEGSQTGTLDVRFDGGAWTNLLTLTAQDRRNNVESFAVNNPNSGTMEFRWRKTGSNNWWWAFDSLRVTGDISGVPYAGQSNATFWNFTTEPEPLLTMTVDTTRISENGGLATATVTRNLTAGELTINLVSSDLTEATVPASVTLLDGVASTTFQISAVNDTEIDLSRFVTITASATGFTSGSVQIEVTDDDGLNVVSLTPPDNSVDFPFSNDLEILFDNPVQAGVGRIYVVNAATNTLGFAVDVNSAAVTFSGNRAIINPPGNLAPLTNYYVLVDSGAIRNTAATVTQNTTLLLETFDLLPLGAFSTATAGGDGTDVTRTPPLGFSIPVNPAGGIADWNGWGFFDKNSWLGGGRGAENNNARAAFTLGQGNIAVADPQAWDNPSSTATYNTVLVTAPIDLTKVVPGTAVLQFDSGFRNDFPMLGLIEVSYNNGTSWTQLASLGATAAQNSTITLTRTTPINSVVGGALVNAQLNNPATGTMRFRFSISNGNNGGWWALDNIRVSGNLIGTPFSGFDAPTAWNFASSELPTLRIAIDPTSISENGGTATATLTRSVFNAGDLTVNLTSSDPGEATVPASVVIPNGQFSTTFTITGVNDAILDGDQVVNITATAAGLLNIPSSLIVKSVDQPIVSTFNPADDSVGVPVGTDFTLTLDKNVKKGNGFIHLMRASDNKREISINVKSSDVSVSGAVVTINPTIELDPLASYYVIVDNGALVADSPEARFSAVLLTENFEKLPLGPAVFEAPLNNNGVDWTATPPTDWLVDNSNMPAGGVPEWRGWTFADKDFWNNADRQGATNGVRGATFTRGQGTVAVADTDEWPDVQNTSNAFNSFFRTPSIDLTTVAPNSLRLEFDSSFRPESGGAAGNQAGVVEVSFDDGATWTNVLTLDANNTSSSLSSSNVNERRVIPVNNSNTGTATFRWGITGTNDFWWAIDNIQVLGTVSGLPFEGVNDPTTWSFTTADTNTLAVSINVASISEDSATPAIGTVTRNLGTTGDVVVTLISSDPGRATVPATVTIRDGSASVNFNITIVDNSLAGGLRNVEISAAATGFVEGASDLAIADDEVANVIITEILYNPFGSEPRSEWIEIYNRGAEDADIGGWKLSDEDLFGVLRWDAIPAGTILPAGGVAVLYNSWFGVDSPAAFRTAWSVPSEAVVIGVQWSDLNNSPSATNELLQLIDAGGIGQNLVNFDDDGTSWPAPVEGPSITLRDITLDNNVGSSWYRSVAGAVSSINPTGTMYDVRNVGSPGVVDLDPPLAPTITLTTDTGLVNNDLVTSNPAYTATGAEVGGSFEYRLNGGDWTSTAPVVTVEGQNVVEARQIDILGRVGQIGSLTFTFDTTAPTAPTIVLVNDTGIPGDNITSDRTYVVTPSEPGGLVEYRRNGGPWQLTPPAGQASNLMEARQTDAAGNVGAIGSLFFRWDRVAPNAPTLSLVQDTGVAGDLVTSNGAVNVAPAEAGGTVEYRLNAGAWSNTLPTAVEGNNLFEARQTDVAGNVGAIGSLQFVLDTNAPAAPTISLDVDSGVLGDFITNDGSYTASQPVAGAAIEYRLNGGAWVTTPPAAVEGANTIAVRQVDLAGNISPSNSLSFTLDSISPVAPTIALTQDTGVNGDSVTSVGTYTVTPAEAGGTIEYQLNGGGWVTTAPTAVQGANAIEVRHTDLAGNVSSVNTLNFTLDTITPVAPAIVLDQDTGISGDSVTSVGTYTVTPAEAGGTVEYRLNGGGWVTTAPTAVEGANTVEVRHTDLAGNVSSVNSISFTLDSMTPVAPTITLDQDTGVNGDSVTSVGTYTVTPSEAGGTVEYRLNGGGWLTTAPTAVEGANAIEVRHTDLAGNVSTVNTLNFTLDTISPVSPTITLDNDTGTAGDSITFDDSFTVSPGEAGGTIEYSTDGVSWSLTSPTPVEGANSISVRQIDLAGNVGAVGVLNFTLDTIASTITNVFVTGSTWNAAFINSIDGDPSNGVGVQLTAGLLPLPWAGVNRLVVQFSENVLAVSGSTIEVRDSSGVLPATVSFDTNTLRATINLATPLSFAKIRVAVNDTVTDVAGNQLDGDNSGAAGGIYNARFNVLAADTNGDGRVNTNDLLGFGTAFNQQPGQAGFVPRMNWNGDNRISTLDLPIFSAAFGRNLGTLGEPGAPFGGGGSGSGSSYSGLVDDIFGGFGSEDDEDDENGLFGGL